MLGAQLRSGSTLRTTAGRRAALLCMSPVSSRETAREGPAKSGGEGSLQTVVDGACGVGSLTRDASALGAGAAGNH